MNDKLTVEEHVQLAYRHLIKAYMKYDFHGIPWLKHRFQIAIDCMEILLEQENDIE